MNAVITVFGDRAWGDHTVDIRGNGQWLKNKFYYVWLMGRENRDLDRVKFEHRMRPLWTLLNTTFIFILLLMLIGTLSIGLYSMKMGFGIDFFPGIDMLPDESIKRFLQTLFE
ncbi:MAG: hypothetical protein HN731_07795 [Rhodospirillaceae bacterium]|nr:hypothetical protein [Rhodospirillaceae bacterium]